MNLASIKEQVVLRDGRSVDISVRYPRRVGAATLAGTATLVLLWSLLAPIQAAVLAHAVVVVKDNRKTVQHLEGGIVSEILVREGQYVDAGQVLLKLSDTQFGAELDTVLSRYFSALAAEARLLAEQALQESVQYPQSLLESVDPRASEAIHTQTTIFEARSLSRSGEHELLRQKIDQLESKLVGLESLKAGKLALIKSYSDEIRDYEDLLREGYSDRTRLREMQRSVALLEAEAAEHEASASTISIEIGETELQLLQMDKDFLASVADELGAVQEKVSDFEERVRALTDKVRRTTIHSPVAGRILDMETHTIGGVILGGEPILQVVPDDQVFVLDCKVMPTDVDRLIVGQTTNIRFSAFNSRDTPVVDGFLIDVSPDVLIDPDMGRPYYAAKVEVAENAYNQLGDFVLIPGMPAEVLIHTGKRSLLQYLWSPVGNSLARAMIND